MSIRTNSFHVIYQCLISVSISVHTSMHIIANWLIYFLYMMCMFGWYAHLCECMFVCVPVHRHVLTFCICVPGLMHASRYTCGGQRLILSVFFNDFPLLVLEPVSVWNRGLLVRLTTEVSPVCTWRVQRSQFWGIQTSVLVLFWQIFPLWVGF